MSGGRVAWLVATFATLSACSVEQQQSVPQPPAQLDETVFACTVEPILARQCSYNACHGQANSPLRVYSPGKLRAATPANIDDASAVLTRRRAARELPVGGRVRVRHRRRRRQLPAAQTAARDVRRLRAHRRRDLHRHRTIRSTSRSARGSRGRERAREAGYRAWRSRSRSRASRAAFPTGEQFDGDALIQRRRRRHRVRRRAAARRPHLRGLPHRRAGPDRAQARGGSSGAVHDRLGRRHAVPPARRPARRARRRAVRRGRRSTAACSSIRTCRATTTASRSRSTTVAARRSARSRRSAATARASPARTCRRTSTRTC